MAKLDAAKRNKLPKSDFAVPGRKYPVNDKKHARNALARVAQHGSLKEKAEVKAKVKAKFPDIDKAKPKKEAKRMDMKKPMAAKRHTEHAGRGGKREPKSHDAIGSHEGYAMGMKKGRK